MKQKKNKTPVLVTVKELKTWLDGYCSAHGDGWSPTPDQWEMIKNKIFSLEDNGQLSASSPASGSPVAYPGVRTPVAPQHRAGIVLQPEAEYQASLDAAGSYGANGAQLVGATERPTFLRGKDGAAKTPDNMSEVTLPSSFA